MAPRVTSSSNRNKRGSAKPVTKGQNPQRSNRQSVSKAEVTKSGDKPKGGARVTRSRDDVGLVAPRKPTQPQPTPRAGGRVVVDESPKLSSGGNKGGALATRGDAVTPPRRGSRVQPVNVKDLGNTKPNQLGGGSSRPSLPPGQRGGAVVTRSGGARSTAAPKPSAATPATRTLPPGQRGGAVATRPGAASRPTASTPKPTSGGARGLLGPGGAPPKAILDLLNKGQPSLPTGKGGGRVNMGGKRGGLLLAAGGAAADFVGTKAGNAIGGFLSNQTNQSRNDPRRNTPGGRSNPGRSSGKPATDGRYIPGSQQTEIKDRSGRQSNASRPEAPKLPAAVTRTSSGGSSSTPSRSGSTPSRSTSTSPARKAPAASTPPSERRVSASTANRESGNYGTSKTNNPLMKDLVARMKDREDKAQSSAASKLTSKFNTESNFSGEKVDGTKYQDSFKKKKKS